MKDTVNRETALPEALGKDSTVSTITGSWIKVLTNHILMGIHVR